MILFITLSVLIFMISLMLYIKQKQFPSIRNLPGPPPNFFLGNVIDFLGPTSEYLNIFHKYSELYGETMKLHEGPITTSVATSDEKFIEYILSSPKLIEKSHHYKFFHKWLGTGLITSTGAKHKNRRRMLTPALHFSNLGNFLEVFDSVGDIFIRKLDEHVNKDSFDIYPLVSLCAMDIICESTMGIPINAQLDGNSQYVKKVKMMLSIITDRYISAISPTFYPLTLNYYREKAALKVIHDHTDRVIDEKMKSKNRVTSVDNKDNEEYGMKTRSTFLDILISSTIDGQPLSRLEVREEVNTIMFAGHDTVSSALSFAIYSLATNQNVQEKAVKEQYQLFGNEKNPKISTADLQNMKYLELVIKETLRIYPPVPYVARRIAEDFEYDGVLYPKDLTITAAPFLNHKNAKYFPEPEKFIPERFDDNFLAKHPYIYLPFSAGPRNCMGQKFAILEMKAILSKVLRNFELLPAYPEHKLALAPEIVLISKNGVKISLRRRNFNQS